MSGTGNETPAVLADEMEVLKREVFRRLVTGGAVAADDVQLDNEIAPETVPYCRITVSGSGRYEFDSQKRMSQLVIVNIDLFGKVGTGTRELSQKGALIESLFGKYDRDAAKREIALSESPGVEAVVERFGRGAGMTESGAGLFRWEVMLYVRLVISSK